MCTNYVFSFVKSCQFRTDRENSTSQDRIIYFTLLYVSFSLQLFNLGGKIPDPTTF